MTKKTIAHKKPGTKRANAPSDITAQKPVDAQTRRAAERARMPTVILPDTDPETQLAFLKDKIVAATDLVSETIAGLIGQGDDDVEFVHDRLSDVLLALWQIRWECYQCGGEVRAAGGAS
jgi:hypothetical protein